MTSDMTGRGWDEFGREGRPAEGGKEKATPIPEIIAAIVVIAAIVIFIAQNNNKTNVEFLFFEGDVRLWVIILVSVILGVALDRLLTMTWRRRRAKRRG